MNENEEKLKKIAEEYIKNKASVEAVFISAKNDQAKKDQLGQLSKDKKKVRLADGRVYDAVVAGDPEKLDSTIILNKDSAMVINEPKKVIHQTSPVKGYVLCRQLLPDEDTNMVRAFLMTVAATPKLYEIPVLDITGLDAGDVDDRYPELAFSPNGQHIFVGYAIDSPGDLRWGWALAWSLNDIDDVVEYESLDQKSVLLDATTLPIPDDPDYPTLPSDYVADGGVVGAPINFIVWEEEDDSALQVADVNTPFLDIKFSHYMSDIGEPKTDVVGHWAYRKVRSQVFRQQACWNSVNDGVTVDPGGYDLGVTPITWGPVLFDVPTGQFYREVSFIYQMNFYSPGVHLIYDGYFVAGTTSIGTPGGWDSNGPGNVYDYNIFPEDVISQHTYGFDAVSLTPSEVGTFEQFQAQSYPTFSTGDDPDHDGPFFVPQTEMSIFTQSWGNEITEVYLVESIDAGAIVSTLLKTIEKVVFDHDDDTPDDGTYEDYIAFVQETTTTGEDWRFELVWKVYKDGDYKYVSVKRNLDAQTFVGPVMVGPTYWFVEDDTYLDLAGGTEIAVKLLPFCATDTHCFVDLISGGPADVPFVEPIHRPAVWVSSFVKAVSSEILEVYRPLAEIGDGFTLSEWEWIASTDSPRRKKVKGGAQPPATLGIVDWMLRSS